MSAKMQVPIHRLRHAQWICCDHNLWHCTKFLFWSTSASVPATSNKLAEWVREYAIFLRGLAQQWRLWKKQNLTQR